MSPNSWISSLKPHENSMGWSTWQLQHTPQTNGQGEQYNWMLITSLGHYVFQHLCDWESLVQKLTTAYKIQGNRSTGTATYSLVLCRHQTGPAKFDRTSVLPTDAEDLTRRSVLWSRLLRCIVTMKKKTDKMLTKAQCKYKDHHEHRARSMTTLRPG